MTDVFVTTICIALPVVIATLVAQFAALNRRMDRLERLALTALSNLSVRKRRPVVSK